MAKYNDLGSGSIKKLVLKLAIPSMVAQFINVLYGIVDRIYIGNIPNIGEIALAGVGVCAPVVTLISSFAFLIGVGGAPLLSIRLGENNTKGAESILSNAFIMILALSAILTSLLLVVKEPLLYLFGASDTTFQYANTYLTICILGTISSLITQGLNQYVICQGYSTVGMLTIVIGAITNIVLDPIMIFGLKMNVAGAAIATVISQTISAIFVMLFLFGKKTKVRIKFTGYSKYIQKRIITFGLSPFIILASDSIIIIVLNSILQKYGGAKYGDMYITCATIVQSYFQLVTMPLLGISGGTQPLLSFNYGAKNIDRVRKAEKNIMLTALIFTSIMFAISQTIPKYFVYIFTTKQEYIDISVWGIRVFTMFIIPLALQYTIVDGFTALGQAKFAISLSMIRKTVFMLSTILVPIFCGVKGAFYAEPIADLTGTIVSVTIFIMFFNKIMKKREEMADGVALYE